MKCIKKTYIRDKRLKCFSHCCLVSCFAYFVMKLLVEMFLSYILSQSNDELFGRKLTQLLLVSASCQKPVCSIIKDVHAMHSGLQSTMYTYMNDVDNKRLFFIVQQGKLISSCSTLIITRSSSLMAQGQRYVNPNIFH